MAEGTTDNKIAFSEIIDEDTLKKIDKIAEEKKCSSEEIVKKAFEEYENKDSKGFKRIIKNINKLANNIELLFEVLKKYINIIIVVVTLYKLYPFISDLLIISEHNNKLPTKEIFGIIGFALAISTAIELLYMLITDGPDEATSPIITAIASTILIVLSNVSIDGSETSFSSTSDILEVSMIVLFLVLSMTLLFVIKHLFFD